jgi:hypothetical protein
MGFKGRGGRGFGRNMAEVGGDMSGAQDGEQDLHCKNHETDSDEGSDEETNKESEDEEDPGEGKENSNIQIPTKTLYIFRLLPNSHTFPVWSEQGYLDVAYLDEIICKDET